MDPSPGAVPAVPEKLGLTFPVELPFAGVVSTITGPIVSTANVTGRLWPRFAASSVCSARAVYVPFWRAAERTPYAPKKSLVVVRVCTGVPTGTGPA